MHVGEYILDDHRFINTGDHFNGTATFTVRFSVDIQNPIQSLYLGRLSLAFHGSARVVGEANTRRNDSPPLLCRNSIQSADHHNRIPPFRKVLYRIYLLDLYWINSRFSSFYTQQSELSTDCPQHIYITAPAPNRLCLRSDRGESRELSEKGQPNWYVRFDALETITIIPITQNWKSSNSPLRSPPE